MKTIVTFTALAASALAAFMPDPVNFTNAWNQTYYVGRKATLSWENGTGPPVDLVMVNSTWSCPIFTGVTSTMYSWTVDPCPGFVPGNYWLVLNQTADVRATSPIFFVAYPNPPVVNSANISAPATIATVTYVYWDNYCGCTKTGIAATPEDTGLPITTTKWWDNVCSCHKSAVVPVSTLPASNYTVPAAPPVTTPAPTSAPAPQPTTTPPATFTGEAVRLGSSILGLVTLVVAMMVA